MGERGHACPVPATSQQTQEQGLRGNTCLHPRSAGEIKFGEACELGEFLARGQMVGQLGRAVGRAGNLCRKQGGYLYAVVGDMLAAGEKHCLNVGRVLEVYQQPLRVRE